jgi:hypothetical protein
LLLRSCRPFNFPSSWDNACWVHLFEDSLCSPRSMSRSPSCWNQRDWFSTPSLYNCGSRNVRSISV